MRAIATLIAVVVTSAACSSEPVRFDPETLECLGSEGAELDVCERQRDELINASFHAAIAQESAFSDLDRYTNDIERLKEERLELQPDAPLEIVRATRKTFCVQATHSVLDATAHYDREEGRIEPGRCRSDEF